VPGATGAYGTTLSDLRRIRRAFKQTGPHGHEAQEGTSPPDLLEELTPWTRRLLGAHMLHTNLRRTCGPLDKA